MLKYHLEDKARIEKDPTEQKEQGVHKTAESVSERPQEKFQQIWKHTPPINVLIRQDGYPISRRVVQWPSRDQSFDSDLSDALFVLIAYRTRSRISGTNLWERHFGHVGDLW